MIRVESGVVIISYAELDYIMGYGYSWWATTEHDMTRIHGIATFAGKSRAEVRAMYDAGVRQWSCVEFWIAWLSGQ